MGRTDSRSRDERTVIPFAPPHRNPLTLVYALLYICCIMHVSVLQTLADPTRFRIVELLCRGEHSVNDIVTKVDVDQSGVSRHLRILQEARFVRVRPEGQRRFYSLCSEPFMDIDAWVNQYRYLWEGRLDMFGQALARKRQAGKLPAVEKKSSRRVRNERKHS